MILRKELGQLIVTSAGDGFWSHGVRRSLSVKLIVSIDPATIERGEDGHITHALCGFVAQYEPEAWDNEELGLPYTDLRIEREINLFLGSLGFTRGVQWSEQGAQQDDAMDFDMGDGLIEQIWPELKLERTV